MNKRVGWRRCLHGQPAKRGHAPRPHAHRVRRQRCCRAWGAGRAGAHAVGLAGCVRQRQRARPSCRRVVRGPCRRRRRRERNYRSCQVCGRRIPKARRRRRCGLRRRLGAPAFALRRPRRRLAPGARGCAGCGACSRSPIMPRARLRPRCAPPRASLTRLPPAVRAQELHLVLQPLHVLRQARALRGARTAAAPRPQRPTSAASPSPAPEPPRSVRLC
jgi:hypothetical protein